jgi:hypothetical protein
MTKRMMQVADLMAAGHTEAEIMDKLGASKWAVRSAKARGRQLGVIPPHKPKPGYAAFIARLGKERFHIGKMAQALKPLSDDERNWLLDRAQGDGYESVAEYLCDVIRAEYDKTLAKKEKAA